MESRRRSHTYKVLKASWGIWISITATIQIAPARRGAADVDSGPCVLAFEGVAASLPESYREALAAGWSEVAFDAEQSVGCDVRVTVEEVKFVDTDFQVDGLPVAMVRWAENAFDLETRPIEVSFDRAANRYDFEWGQ